MNVLSLFDGMSCGMIALQRAGIEVTNYFASEIDKYAQIISQKNFPEIIRLGDVTKVFAKDLPKIDLIIGGSPCQGFSMAGKMLGHEDPRSKLFWEFKRLVDECNPKYFLLENVRMKKQDEQIITDAMGVKPLMINSTLVSAQNRKRLYWTNINADVCDLFGTLQSHIPQPKDKHLFLKDIIEPEVEEKYYLTKKQIEMLLQHKQRHEEAGNGFGIDPKTIEQKSLPLSVKGKMHTGETYLYCDYRYDKGFRIVENGKSGCIRSEAGGPDRQGLVINNNSIRRLTPIECERLQTVPDNYTAGVSETQRYKMLGNGWTVDVTAHILSYI